MARDADYDDGDAGDDNSTMRKDYGSDADENAHVGRWGERVGGRE